MQCGNRTIPEAIDALSTEQPDRVWARYFANSNDFEAGAHRNVTFATLAGAIDVLAWYLDDVFSECDPSITLLYIGPSDILYFIFACAACKNNRKVLRAL
jgi:hypothetical protein